MELKIKIKKDGCLFLFGVIYIKSFIFFNYQKKKKNSQNSIKFPNSSKIEVCHNNNFKSIIKSTKEKKIVQKLEFQFSLVSFL